MPRLEDAGEVDVVFDVVGGELRAHRLLDTIVEAILGEANERALAVPGNSGPRASQRAH